MDKFHIRGGTHEGKGDKVHSKLKSKTEIIDILLRQGRYRNIHTGKRNTLVVGDRATFSNQADDIWSIDVIDNKTYLAIINEETIPRLGICRELLVGSRDTVMRTFAILNSNGDGFTSSPYCAVILEAAQTNLWTLQICKNTNRFTSSLRRLTHPLIILRMVGMLTMGHIHPRHIHADIYKFADCFGRCDSGT